MRSYKEQLREESRADHIKESKTDIVNNYQGARKNRLLKFSLVTGALLIGAAVCTAMPAIMIPFFAAIKAGGLAVTYTGLNATLQAAGVFAATGAAIGGASLSKHEIGKRNAR